MGMADTYEWPTEIRLQLSRDAEPQLTCWLCGRQNTTMTYQWLLGGRRTVAGVHAECVKNMKQTTR